MGKEKYPSKDSTSHKGKMFSDSNSMCVQLKMLLGCCEDDAKMLLLQCHCVGSKGKMWVL